MSEADPFTVEPRGGTRRGPGLRRRAAESPSPAELSRWLEARVPSLAERWTLEVRARSHEVDGPLVELLSEFLALLVSFLPFAVGPWKDHVKPLFQQSAELYGNLAAVRGLAAGEAVEEMQLLRELLLRTLHQDPPGGDGTPYGGLGLRELLQLNRFVDDAVTYASVGHMDTLFFNLLHGSGVTRGPEGTMLEEIGRQVEGLAEELETVRPLRERGSAPPAN